MDKKLEQLVEKRKQEGARVATRMLYAMDVARATDDNFQDLHLVNKNTSSEDGWCRMVYGEVSYLGETVLIYNGAFDHQDSCYPDFVEKYKPSRSWLDQLKQYEALASQIGEKRDMAARKIRNKKEKEKSQKEREELRKNWGI